MEPMPPRRDGVPLSDPCRIGAGPLSGQIVGDHGAEVDKIKRPRVGE